MFNETGNLSAGGAGDTLPNPLVWRFLDEPLWRWTVFVIALGLMLRAWQGVLTYMR